MGGGGGVRRVGWTRRVFMPSPQSPPPPPQLPGGEERTSVRHRSGRRRVVAPNWRVTKKISHDNNKTLILLWIWYLIFLEIHNLSYVLRNISKSYFGDIDLQGLASQCSPTYVQLESYRSTFQSVIVDVKTVAFTVLNAIGSSNEVRDTEENSVKKKSHFKKWTAKNTWFMVHCVCA